MQGDITSSIAELFQLWVFIKMLNGVSKHLLLTGGLTLAAVCSMSAPAAAARFSMEIAYTESQLLPPWDLPETGTGFFDFDGVTYGDFVTSSLIFQNFETFPGNPFFPGGQTEPYPPNTESLLTPIVFSPSTALVSTPTQLSAIGSLDFQTAAGTERCLTDPIARGGALCDAFIPAPAVQLDLLFDNPIFNVATNQFLPSNFSWSLTTTVPLDVPGLRFSIPAGSLVAGGTNVDVPNPFAGNIGPTVIPANRATPLVAASVPEPRGVLSLLMLAGVGGGFMVRRAAGLGFSSDQ